MTYELKLQGDDEYDLSMYLKWKWLRLVDFIGLLKLDIFQPSSVSSFMYIVPGERKLYKIKKPYYSSICQWST